MDSDVTDATNRYHAFLSYSHRVDRELARVFQLDLERFGGRFPWSRVARVYRDETNLAATPDLWGTIESALSASANLILLASPEATKSIWIPRELKHFIAERGASRMCVVLTRGKTPFTDAGEIADAERALTDTTLAELGATQPLVVDLRPFRDRPRQARGQHDYQNAIATVASFITGVDKDRLFSEHIARRRRWTWILGALAVAMAVLAALSVIQTVGERSATRRALAGEAREKRLRQIEDVELLVARARTASPSQPREALSLAADAYRRSRALDGPELDDVARARTEAAASLGFALEGARGLLRELRGNDSTVTSLTVNADHAVRGLEESGHILRWVLSDPGTPPVVEAVRTTDETFARNGPFYAVGDTWFTTLQGVEAHETNVLVTRAGSEHSYPLAADTLTMSVCGPDRVVISGANVIGLWEMNVENGKFSRIADTTCMGLRCSMEGLIACNQNDRVDLWDRDARKLLRSIPCTNVNVNPVAMDSGATRIATECGPVEAPELHLWTITGKSLGQWPVPLIRNLKLDIANPERIHTAHADGTVRTWAIGSAEPLIVRPAHHGQVTTLALDPVDGTLVTAGIDGAVRLWDPNGRDPLVNELAGSEGYSAARIDGKDVVALVSSANDVAVRYWSADLKTSSDRAAPAGFPTWSAAIGPGDLLVGTNDADTMEAQARTDGTIEIAHTDTGELFDLPSSPPLDFLWWKRISPDGRFLAAIAALSKQMQIWDLAKRERIRVERGDGVEIFAFDQNGSHLAAIAGEGELRLWNTTPFALDMVKQLDVRSVTTIAFDAASKRLALGTDSGSVEVRTIADGKRTFVVNTLGNDIQALAFQPGGGWLAMVDSVGAISIVDLASSLEILHLPGRPSGLHLQSLELAFDAKGKRLFVARGDDLEVVATDPDEWARIAERIAN